MHHLGVRGRMRISLPYRRKTALEIATFISKPRGFIEKIIEAFYSSYRR
jgi:hypothetical protein